MIVQEAMTGDVSPVAMFYLIFSLRVVVKYYFADFVRKGGTPPFKGKIFGKKGVTDFGGTPSPPLRTFPQNFFFKKG